MSASSKLTLSVDKDIIEKAKAYAKDRGKSLSGMIEDYLRLILSMEKAEDESTLPPITASLKGIISLKDKDYKEIYEDILLEKYRLK